jgi:hypothetical protein
MGGLVSFMPWPLYPQRNGARYVFDIWLGVFLRVGPDANSLLPLAGIKTQFL